MVLLLQVGPAAMPAMGPACGDQLVPDSTALQETQARLSASEQALARMRLSRDQLQNQVQDLQHQLSSAKAKRPPAAPAPALVPVAAYSELESQRKALETAHRDIHRLEQQNAMLQQQQGKGVGLPVTEHEQQHAAQLAQEQKRHQSALALQQEKHSRELAGVKKELSTLKCVTRGSSASVFICCFLRFCRLCVHAVSLCKCCLCACAVSLCSCCLHAHAASVSLLPLCLCCPYLLHHVTHLSLAMNFVP